MTATVVALAFVTMAGRASHSDTTADHGYEGGREKVFHN
jgi:hypothetical protein